MLSTRYFKRFNKIDCRYILTDKHIHTTWTDGKDSLPDMLHSAEALGLSQIAFTEHVREKSSYIKDYLKQINKIKQEVRIEVLTGFEAKIANFYGDLDAPMDAMQKAMIMIASVHRFPLGRKLFSAWQFSKKICQELELELSLAALRAKRCNVLGHAGGMSLTTYKEFPDKFFEEIILGCKKNNIAFELNLKYHIHILPKLLRLLKKYNPFVSFGSDAHSIADLKRYRLLLRKFFNA